MDRRTFLAGLSAATASSACGKAEHLAFGDSQLNGFLRTNWSKDPLSRGAYSFVAKGTSPADYAALAQPVQGKVYFAGEAVFDRFNSTVHAAYLSGLASAKTLLEGKAKKVAVIGAGMSGLAAAQALARAGRDVTVFEARDRIGGRVWTSSELGPPVDLGGAWIHGIKGNPLTSLADELALKRDLTDDSYVVRGKKGRKLGAFSTPGWLFNEGEIQVAYGADAEWIDPSGFTETDGFDGPDVTFRDGYAAIFEALSGDYAVELGRQVASVSYGTAGVALAFADNSKHAFDAVIVTVPLGVLKDGAIAFDPPLPETKRKAIERIGFGLLDKLYLKFDEAFWDSDATWIYTPENGLARGHFNQWFNLHRHTGEPIIVALNGGSAALELAEESDEALVEKAVATLKGAYPA